MDVLKMLNVIAEHHEIIVQSHETGDDTMWTVTVNGYVYRHFDLEELLSAMFEHYMGALTIKPIGSPEVY